jgi:hypothetical protein
MKKLLNISNSQNSGPDHNFLTLNNLKIHYVNKKTSPIQHSFRNGRSQRYAHLF